MDVIEEYNKLLRRTEDDIIRLLNGVLDRSFNRLVRRTRIHMRAGYADQALRNQALLQEFRQLIPVFRPDRLDRYDRLLRTLLKRNSRQGVKVAEVLTRQMAPEKARVDVSIPLEATYQAASQAKGYLRKHGQKFAETSAEIVAQGIVEGRPTDEIVGDMRSRLGVVKSRAEVIVRTESLRAYNEATNTYYSAQGIEQVLYYATADDRSCPVCAPRAGNVYKRGSIKVPVHPRCVLPNTKIIPGHVLGAIKAQYFGTLVTIRTASGRICTVTENHPMATTRGWVAAKELVETDKLLSYSSRVPRAMGFNTPNFDNRPTTAEQIFKTMRATFPMSTTTVPSSTMDLHGEGRFCYGDIQVVWSNRPLLDNIDTCGPKNLRSDLDLIGTDVKLPREDSLSFFDLLLLGCNAAVSGEYSVMSETTPLFKRKASIAELRSFRSAAWGDPRLLEPRLNSGPGAAEDFCKLINTKTTLIECDQLTGIEIQSLRHPITVYDFTTNSSCYLADDLVVHNCRCYLAPWDPEIEETNPEYASSRESHKQEVKDAVSERGLAPESILNKRGVFELLTPQPLN